MVMLGCLGYEGHVTFTDLAVKPIYGELHNKVSLLHFPFVVPAPVVNMRRLLVLNAADYKLIKNQIRIEPKYLLVLCQAPSRRPHQKSGDFLTEILFSDSSPTVST